MKFTQLKKIIAVSVFGSLLATSSISFAADNPKPSSWQNIVVKATETYGNNQSRPLRGAKVIIELVDPNSSQDYKTRFPQTKTSGPRGATFTRMPPSSMVGEYRVTVIPKPFDKAQKYSCTEKEKTFIHSSRKTTNQFTFNCQLNRGNANRTASNNNNQQNNKEDSGCHKVRIQKQEGKRKTITTQACMQKDGKWHIEGYQY